MLVPDVDLFAELRASMLRVVPPPAPAPEPDAEATAQPAEAPPAH